jgi:hypothetical protein
MKKLITTNAPARDATSLLLHMRPDLSWGGPWTRFASPFVFCEERGSLQKMAEAAAVPWRAQDDRPHPDIGGQNLPVKICNYHELSLYLVRGNAVYMAHPESEWEDSPYTLVAATSETSALQVAAAHIRGDARYQALGWSGDTISVVFMRAPDGLYV